MPYRLHRSRPTVCLFARLVQLNIVSELLALSWQRSLSKLTSVLQAKLWRDIESVLKLDPIGLSDLSARSKMLGLIATIGTIAWIIIIVPYMM